MAKNMSFALLLDFYSKALTDKQREIIEMYYYDDLSLAEIADNCGITRQGARDAIKHAEASLLELERQIGFAKWHSRLREGMDHMRTLAQEIMIINDRQGYSVDLQRRAAAIVDEIDSVTKEEL